MFADSGGVSVHFLPVRAGAAGGGGRILRHAAGRDDATGGESGRSEGFPKDREQHTLRSAAQVRLDYLVSGCSSDFSNDSATEKYPIAV